LPERAVETLRIIPPDFFDLIIVHLMTPLYLALLGIDQPSASSTHATDRNARPWIHSLTSQIANLLRKGAERLDSPSVQPETSFAPEPTNGDNVDKQSKESAKEGAVLRRETLDDAMISYSNVPISSDSAALASFFHYNYPSVSFVPPFSKHRDYSKEAPLAVQCIVKCRIPTDDKGTFNLFYYINNRDSEHHMAIVYGDFSSETLEKKRIGETEFDRMARGATFPDMPRLEGAGRPCLLTDRKNGNAASNSADSQDDVVLVRIHSACYTGETVGSARCDCAEQLNTSMIEMSKLGRGIILYLRQEGRGIGLADKMRAYNLQDEGHDTVNANLMLHLPADAREYNLAALMLKDLHVDTVDIMTNNPDKIKGLTDNGIQVVSRKAMIPQKWQKMIHGTRSQTPSQELQDMDVYLLTKINRMGHELDVPDAIRTGAARASSDNSQDVTNE